MHIPPPNFEDIGGRRFIDASALRELRKRLESTAINPMELDALAQDLLPEIAQLSSDYIGNSMRAIDPSMCRTDAASLA